MCLLNEDTVGRHCIGLCNLHFGHFQGQTEPLYSDIKQFITLVFNRSPFRLDPRGWEPHFVATERRPQGALLTSWQNPTFTEEGFCYKMAVQDGP